jgi:hypothetical protein
VIDVSTIDPVNTGVCMLAHFSSDGISSPILNNRYLSYFSSQKPFITFDLQVLTSAISNFSINNLANIYSYTPEIRLDNNQSDYTMFVKYTDLRIQKSVDKKSAFPSDLVTYTLHYFNN